MKAPTGNWLLTFSDLFFILVAFFLLRHQMIETPVVTGKTATVGLAANTPNTKNLARLTDTSIYQPGIEQLSTTLKIPIQHSWFSGQSELSSKGEEAIRDLGWKLSESKTNISLELYINRQQASLSSEQRQMLEALVEKLNELNIQISSVNISTKDGAMDGDYGVIEINYN